MTLTSLVFGTISTQTLAILVLAFPAAGAVLLAGRGWRWPRVLTQMVGPGAVWLSFICVALLFWRITHDPCLQDLSHSCYRSTASDYQPTYWTWIHSGSFELPFNLLIDQLSLFMGLVITGVGGLIVTYSVGYMEHEDDPSYARFFCYMDLFILSMLLLVLAGNFVFLIIGWALVGLSSYLLIGFWYQRRSAVLAARKAFVMNVIGDVGMILGAFVLWSTYHQLSYGPLFDAIRFGATAQHPQCTPSLLVLCFVNDTWELELAGFLLLVGAVAKSAQLPLHTWLPDAMEGPTPVSALIHAATMVTAGVYLVGRMHPIYDLAPIAHSAVAIIGTATALFAATIAMVQTDIKRVLAYSTMSQIGYMFLAVGIGAYAAGFFHLMGHAFFKALLFMAAGNVIHALHDEQDMRKWGGMSRHMPWTSVCFLIGSLSLAGIIPLVGFWSKELVLGDTFSRGDPLALTLWAVGFGTALLTGFYTGRMWYLAFSTRPGAETEHHVHEAYPVMLVPVAILTVLTAVGGFLQVNAGFHPGWKLIEDFLGPSVGVLPWQPRDLEYLPTAATVLLSGLTFFWARSFYKTQTRRPEEIRDRVPWLQTLLERKYYWDEAYDLLFVRPLDWSARAAARWIDDPVIDGAVTGTAATVRGLAREVGRGETGYFRNYVLVFLGGSVVAAAILIIIQVTR
jgi:NADH-quinone oxidoreductase subunit L